MRRINLTVAAAAGLVLLSACAEDEIILPGPREEPRAVLQDAAAEPAPAAQVDTARAISLPVQRANTDWTHRPGTQLYRTDHPALGRALTPIWSTGIGSGDTRRFRIGAAPVVAGGRIFTLDSRAQVTATAANGAVQWTRDLTPARDSVRDAGGGGLALGGGQLFVSSGFGKLTALDPATGAVNWTQDLDATGNGTPVYLDGLVYLVAGNSTAWAIEADTGRIRWQIDAAPSINNVMNGTAPAVTDDLAILAFGSGRVQAVFRKGGLSRWSASVVGQRPGSARATVSDITGDPVVDGNAVYAGNYSGRLAKLDLGSGEALWTAKEGALGPVWPAGDSVFVVTDLNQLMRLDAADGSRIWAVDLPGFVRERKRGRTELHAHYGPVLAGGRLIVASSDGAIRSFDPVSGALTGRTDIPGGAGAPPVVAGGVLYVVSTKGRLHAFR